MAVAARAEATTGSAQSDCASATSASAAVAPHPLEGAWKPPPGALGPRIGTRSSARRAPPTKS
jgi:hypothetical protein